MEKRVLIAVALSFLVLYGYQAFFPPPKTATQTVAPPAVKGAPPAEPAGQQAPAEADTPAAAAAALVADAGERDIVVENDAVRAVFTNRGAVLKSWVLKRYRDHSGALLDLLPQAVKGGP